MKCDRCPASRTVGYEYPEDYCYIGNDADLDYPDGSCGCSMHHATIKKRVRQNEEAESRMYDGMAEWYEKRQKRETNMAKAIREVFRKKGCALYMENGLRKLDPESADIYSLTRAILEEYDDLDAAKEERPCEEQSSEQQTDPFCAPW